MSIESEENPQDTLKELASLMEDQEPGEDLPDSEPASPVEPEAPETDEVETEEEEEQPEQPRGGFREAVASRFGVDLSQKYLSDDEAVQGLLQAYRKIGERDEDAQLGKAFRENPQQFAQYFTPPTPQEDPNAPPEWKDEWEAGLERDEDGNLISKRGYDPSLPQKYEAHKKWMAARVKDLVSNPDKFLGETVEKRARQVAEEMVQSQMGQVQTQMEVQQFLDTNRQWLFRDPSNPASGLSPQGLVFERAVRDVDARGWPIYDQIKYGVNAVMAEFPSRRSEPPKPKKAPARRTPSKAKPAPDSEATKFPAGQTLEEELLKVLEETGMNKGLA